MRTILARIAPLLIAAAAAVSLATPAAAAPECINPGPNTTICQTPGHSQITTSPNPALTNPFPGMYGGFGVGLGGVWIGW